MTPLLYHLREASEDKVNFGEKQIAKLFKKKFESALKSSFRVSRERGGPLSNKLLKYKNYSIETTFFIPTVRIQ